MDHSSYRNELAGIHAVLTVTNKLCEFYKVQEGRATIGSDGLSALTVSLQGDLFLATDDSNFDLVAAVYNMRKCSPIEWVRKFVRGHQDDSSGELDIWAMLNVQMGLFSQETHAICLLCSKTLLSKRRTLANLGEREEAHKQDIKGNLLSCP
jgi:hypothetical protein